LMYWIDIEWSRRGQSDQVLKVVTQFHWIGVSQCQASR